MSATWITKYGSRRVRHDPPTLVEAIAAAAGLTEDREQQAAIAADLMGIAVAEVRAELVKLQPDRRTTLTVIAPARDRSPRTVVVEHKMSRRVATRTSDGKAGVSVRVR